MNKIKYLLTVFVVLAAAGIIYNSKAIASGIKNGITLCIDAVIPSLFLFSVICIFIVNAELLSQNKIVDFISNLLFGVKGELGVVALISLVCGYPVGGALINELYLKGKINREYAANTLCYCINAGPAFVIGIIGNKLYNNSAIGWIILISSLLSTVICGRILNRKITNTTKICTPIYNCDYIGSFLGAVNVAVKNMAAICGWVLISSATIAVINPIKRLNIIGCLLEVTAGVTLAAQNYSIYFVAFLIGFGGISVHLQAISAAKSISPSYIKILIWKTVQGILTASFTYALLKIFPQYFPTSNISVEFGSANGGNIFTAAVTVMFIMSTMIFINQKLNSGRKL